MRNSRIYLSKISIIYFPILFIYKCKIIFSYYRNVIYNIIVWLINSKETNNFSYDLDETNTYYLASLIAHITNEKYETIIGYINELQNDQELKKHLNNMYQLSKDKNLMNAKIHYGRRIGWYAIARCIKPKIIIETGVDKGLGSCILASALEKNFDEGFEGKYYGTDIDNNAGYLFSSKYSKFGEILYGDSINTLLKFDKNIDLFINDSDHSSTYEEKEYTVIANKLSKSAIILGDNSHCTDKLLKFSIKYNREFIFFAEKPKKHWYPGAGIGISF